MKLPRFIYYEDSDFNEYVFNMEITKLVIIGIISFVLVMSFLMVLLIEHNMPTLEKCDAISKQYYVYGDHNLNLTTKQFIYDSCERLKENILMGNVTRPEW